MAKTFKYEYPIDVRKERELIAIGIAGPQIVTT